MTLPAVPRRRPVLVPRGSPTVDPDHQTQRAHAAAEAAYGPRSRCPPIQSLADRLLASE
jgi:hypothetical protein